MEQNWINEWCKVSMPRFPWRYLSLFIDLVLIVDESIGHRSLVPSVDIGGHLRATDTEVVIRVPLDHLVLQAGRVEKCIHSVNFPQLLVYLLLFGILHLDGLRARRGAHSLHSNTMIL